LIGTMLDYVQARHGQAISCIDLGHPMGVFTVSLFNSYSILALNFPLHHVIYYIII